MISTDVVIVGGGCVGLTLALAIAEQGIKVAVIDAQQQVQPLSEGPELRVSAISSASEAIFSRLGVWDEIKQTRACSYEKMQVWEKDSFGAISFSAAQVHTSHLGHIVENQLIRQVLLKRLEQYPEQAQLLFDQPLKQVNVAERQVMITLADGTPVLGQLLVGADGANSLVRRQMNMPISYWDHEHNAVVATVKTELDHQHCASQCFLPDGPLAFLPLSVAVDGQPPGQKFCSIVWSTSPAQAKTLVSCSEVEFNQRLTAAFDGRLGLCQVQSKRLSFPLTMRYARTWVKPRVALIGDAAHTIHPLAGLGMNLGLLDAATLAQTLIELKQGQKDYGEVANLRSFERWRKSEAQVTIAAMEGLKRLFAGANPVLKFIRSSGLLLADNIAPAKAQIIKQAMGLVGELPALAKPLNRD